MKEGIFCDNFLILIWYLMLINKKEKKWFPVKKLTIKKLITP